MNNKTSNNVVNGGEVVIYPKDLRENLLFRANLMEKANGDDKLKDALKLKAKNDILFFFNVFLWTYDPRRDVKHRPFITYEFQDEYLTNISVYYGKQEDFLTEKSRDMGASWLAMGFILHKWLFEDGFSALLGSYKENKVDDGTLDSHFGRLEYLVEHLPKWMRPRGYIPTRHRSSMKLYNPENSNFLAGEAPTKKFSRQGRYSLIFADEFAFWEYARQAWLSMGDATKCRVVTSTPDGKGNKYGELATKSNIKKFTLHWKMHPLKDEKWYNDQKARRTEQEIAQELDINYNKSTTSQVYPEFHDFIFSEKQEYNPLQPLYVSWDFGLNDQTALIWLQLDLKTGMVRIIDAYQNSGKTVDFYVPFITGVAPSKKIYKYTKNDFRLIDKHKDWQEAVHYGDPTGENKHQTSNTSVIRQLRDHGIVINYNRKKFDIESRINATKLLMRRLKVDKDLVEFIDAIQNARYPTKSDLNQGTTGNEKPIHDWTSHFRTALEFYAVNENLRRGIAEKAVQSMRRVTNSVFDRAEEYLQNRKGSKKSSKPYKTCA